MADFHNVKEAASSGSENKLLRKQLAAVVRSIQWSYAIFWSSSPTQPRVLEWGEGCYNGEIKKRKKRYEANYKYGLERSKQLRKLYVCMLQGDTTTTTTNTNDDHSDNNTTKMLSPDDLSDEEWYYLVSMSYVFSPSQCLPGRAWETNETTWLCNAQYADNKLFTRSLLAKSASIQTVMCFPYLGGVIELGVTELISEDHNLLQHIKSCLLETSKPDCLSSYFSTYQENSDENIEKNQMGLKMSEENSMFQENYQIPLDSSDEDLHYKRTVSTVLRYSGDRLRSKNNKNIHDSASSFLRWKRFQHPKQSNFQPSQNQNVLQKILHNVPLMHSADKTQMFQTQRFGPNQDDRRKENEKFSVLRSMVPTVNEIDKESILNNTIKYLQELEARVEELESCMGSVDFVERQRKTTMSVNESVLIEETSGNYDDITKIDGNAVEMEKVMKEKTDLKVKVKEKEVMIEVKCCYRDYIVADIMETMSNLHMDAFSVRSHTLNGFLTLNLKAKFRGAAVASVGMIKREIKRVVGGECTRIT